MTFTEPTHDGGRPVTGYRVTASPGGLTVDCRTSPCVMAGLNNGTAYTFTVAAINEIGHHRLPGQPR